MGAFETKTVLYASPEIIPDIADRICTDFGFEGYEVKRDDLISGGVDISVTKGNVFKAIIGMRTALKITLTPQGDRIGFEAGVGLFGHMAIPTIIGAMFFWPVLVTQMWGLIQQSGLDKKALECAKAVVAQSGKSHAYTEQAQRSSNATKFCTNCGAKLPAEAKFCSGCGNKLG